METAIELSVIVPTLAREETLARTVQSLLQQSLGSDRYEVLVVDNGPRRETRELIESIVAVDRRVRYIECPLPGVHNARNLGALLARGTFLGYVDDDIHCSTTWCESIIAALAGEAECAGGSVEPIWGSAPPEWIQRYRSLLALLDRGPAVRRLFWPEDIYSCNFAIRRQTLLDAGGFNPELVGEKYVGDGETGLLFKLWDLQVPVYYDPRLEVRHEIAVHRLNERYFIARFKNQGVSQAFTSFRRYRSLARLTAEALALVPLSVGYWLFARLFSLVSESRARHAGFYAAYCAARMNYSWKLILDSGARSWALRDEWFSDVAQLSSSQRSRSEDMNDA